MKMKINKTKLLTLWYEDEKGNKFIPDFTKNEPDFPPEEFRFQHARFPCTLRETVNMSVIQKEVDECDHEQEFVHKTGGWIDGVEGRECKKCCGTQVKKIEDAWPEKWDANGSRQICAGESGWPEDLVLNMAKSGDFKLSEAIIVAATSCERCMNSLAHKYGLDWGYEEESEEWKESRTYCDFCEHMGHYKNDNPSILSATAGEDPPLVNCDSPE